jgi:small subunit ribosomal protein S1
LLEASSLKPKRFSPGEKVEAVVVKISPEWVFIDLGAKSEGYLDRKELVDDEGRLTVKEGDTITAYFLSSRHSEKLFTTKLQSKKSVDDFLVNAYQNQIPINALVEKEIKGGFSVKIGANISGFCPFSQMDRRKIDNPSVFVGKKFDFIVIEYGEKGRKIVLSRRPILEKIELEKVEKLKSSLQKGMAVQGVITSVHDFGAFVDLGGVQALLPVSEMAWGRVEDVKSVFKPGDVIEAVIIHLDWEKDRITVSYKDTLPDPWNDVIRKYVEGSIHKGKVSRLTDFGAFITLEPGVDGLVHISKLGKGKKIKHPSDVLSVGREMDVKIEKIDRDNKKISLDLAALDDGKEAAADEEGDDYRDYMPKAPKTMGTFGDLLSKVKKKK